jgi:GntR family transcriptional regulator
VIPFRVQFRPGLSLYEQVVYAAKKAIVSGAMRAGDPFPSVRTLSKELKINPNTAHKIVMKLVNDGLLETRPGIGNLAATLPESSKQERTQLLGNEIEQLVVEARKLGIEFAEIVQSMEAHWKRLGQHEVGSPQKNEPGGRKR